MKNKSFFDSLHVAFTGLIVPLVSERNMRVHFSFANLILVFAYFFGISRCEWAVLVLTIGAVISSELINTAIENAVDTATKEFSKSAKIAKDTAAAAVLCWAICAVLVGICLFLDIEKIGGTLAYIFTTPKILIPCLMLGAFDVLFVIFGGKIKLNIK